MYRQQTIVMSIDIGKDFEKVEKEESFFLDTNFDLKVHECIGSIMAEGHTLQGVYLQATDENLVAIIAYDDQPQNRKISPVVSDVPNLKIPS